MIRLGIDLGGTKIEICALDANGNILMRERRDTPQGDYDATIDAIANLVHDAERNVGKIASVGIGTPGAISARTGLMKNSNSVCLNHKPLQRDIEARLGRAIHISNDANCFALSEAVDGAAAGADVVFGVIVGTGTGAGIVVNGRVLEGPNRIAGEWGHNPLPWPSAHEIPGPPCYCGKNGCIETYLSGPGLARDHFTMTNEKTDAKSIAVRAKAGEPLAVSTMNRYLDRFARALASVINILDPDVIVLGGGMSNIDVIYDQVPKMLLRYVFSDELRTTILRAKYGDSSGVRGAAWL